MKLFWFALLLFVPSVSAGWGATNEGGLQHYDIDAYAQSTDNPATGLIFTRTITTTPIHDYDITTSTGLITFTGTVVVSNSASGVWRITASWDGVDIPNCYWNIETIGGLGVPATFPFFGIFCELTNAQLAGTTHTLNLTRSTLSGSPSAISHADYAYHITRSDLLVPDMTNDLIEFASIYAPLVLFVAVVIWAEMKNDLLLFFMATLIGGAVVVLSFLDDFPAIFRTALVLGTIFMALRIYQTVNQSKDV